LADHGSAIEAEDVLGAGAIVAEGLQSPGFAGGHTSGLHHRDTLLIPGIEVVASRAFSGHCHLT